MRGLYSNTNIVYVCMVLWERSDLTTAPLSITEMEQRCAVTFCDKSLVRSVVTVSEGLYYDTI